MVRTGAGSSSTAARPSSPAARLAATRPRAGARSRLDGSPGALTIRDSELDANRAGAGGLGGAIAVFSPSSQLVVERSRLSGNGAFEGGAVALPTAGDARLRIADSTFDANTAAGAGSAVWVSDDFPGGQAGLDLLSDTFLGGSAGTGGALGGTISDLALHDSVLAGNTGGSCSGPGVISRGHNLTDDATCGLAGPGDHQGVDPRLDPLAANGGPTATAMPRLDSPLLDAADGGCDATDARGVPRPQGSACDIGATERSASAPRRSPRGSSAASPRALSGSSRQRRDTVRSSRAPTSGYPEAADERVCTCPVRDRDRDRYDRYARAFMDVLRPYAHGPTSTSTPSRAQHAQPEPGRQWGGISRSNDDPGDVRASEPLRA